MTRAEVSELLELPLPERVEREWDSLPVTDRERKLLDDSLEAYCRDPSAGTPWPEAKAELLRQL